MAKLMRSDGHKWGEEAIQKLPLLVIEQSTKAVNSIIYRPVIGMFSTLLLYAEKWSKNGIKTLPYHFIILSAKAAN